MTQHYREAYLVSDWSKVSAPKKFKTAQRPINARKRKAREDSSARRVSARRHTFFFVFTEAISSSAVVILFSSCLIVVWCGTQISWKH